MASAKYGPFSTHKGQKFKKAMIALVALSLAMMFLPQFFSSSEGQVQAREGASGGAVEIGAVYSKPKGADEEATDEGKPSESSSLPLEDQIVQEVTQKSEKFIEAWANYTPTSSLSIESLPFMPKAPVNQGEVSQQIEAHSNRIKELQESTTFTTNKTSIVSVDYDGGTAQRGEGVAVVEISGSALVTSKELGIGGTTRNITYTLTLTKQNKSRDEGTDWFISSIKEK